MGTSSYPATISGSWLNTSYPFVTTVEGGSSPSTLERSKGDSSCLTSWTTISLFFVAVLFFFSSFFGYDWLTELFYLLPPSRVWICVAAWDALYCYDGRGVFAWVIIGDISVAHVSLSPVHRSSITIILRLYMPSFTSVNVLLLPHVHLITHTIFIASYVCVCVRVEFELLDSIDGSTRSDFVLSRIHGTWRSVIS